MKCFVRLAAFAILMSGCTTTKGSYITDAKSFWFEDIQRGLLYCESNAEDKAGPRPICFKAKHADDLVKRQ
jgi:hypothetical protein